MRPEKKERVFDNEPYCKSCRRSAYFCQCTGHNSCHDLHTEWFKSDECKSDMADIIVCIARADKRLSNVISLKSVDSFVSAISKYLGGQ